jgi:hypothetical protein
MNGRRAKILRKQAKMAWDAGKGVIHQAFAYDFRRFWQQYKRQYLLRKQAGRLPNGKLAA